MTRPSGTWPPLPPSPPDPPFPRHTPWLPEPRPTSPGPVSASAMVVGVHDWLEERLLDQRVVAVAGELDDETVNRRSPPWPCSTPTAMNRSGCGCPA